MCVKMARYQKCSCCLNGFKRPDLISTDEIPKVFGETLSFKIPTELGQSGATMAPKLNPHH
jgi:hypothetical protein